MFVLILFCGLHPIFISRGFECDLVGESLSRSRVSHCPNLRPLILYYFINDINFFLICDLQMFPDKKVALPINDSALSWLQTTLFYHRVYEVVEEAQRNCIHTDIKKKLISIYIPMKGRVFSFYGRRCDYAEERLGVRF